MIPVSNDFKNAVTATSRQFDARLTLNVPGYITNGVYGDDVIINFNIVEEYTTLSDTLPSDQCTITLDNQYGTFNYLSYNNMTSILASTPTMFVELGLHLDINDPASAIEWIPAGYFFMDSWKMDPIMKTVTLIGHDWLTKISNYDFPPGTFTSMNDVVTKVFQIVGCSNYSIDPVVSSSIYNTSKITTQDMDCRQALQFVGIATNCAVYQDRYGKMMVKPFSTLLNNGVFSSYASTQSRLFGYATTQYNVYPEINDDGGNRRISMANMFEIPMIDLQLSIYQLKINVYSSGSVNHSPIYINPRMGNGSNGVAFTIDNPFIDSDTIAQKVADFYFAESNYNANYTCQWRQNPSIQCGDIVLVDDGQTVDGVVFASNKISRVTRQEFNYEGALSGTSEVRGGA
jgi:hypothetical protein